jgi:hypothetical protein
MPRQTPIIGGSPAGLARTPVHSGGPVDTEGAARAANLWPGTSAMDAAGRTGTARYPGVRHGHRPERQPCKPAVTAALAQTCLRDAGPKIAFGSTTVGLRRVFDARRAIRGHSKSWRQQEKRPFRATRTCDEMPTLRPADGGSRQAVRGLRQGSQARARGFGCLAQQATDVPGWSSRGNGSDICSGSTHAGVGATARLATTRRMGRRRSGGDRNRLSRAA